MSDKIVNHFVLADGSVARYDYDSLVNAPFGDDATEVSYKTRGGYVDSYGKHNMPSATTQEVYTNKLPCFPGDTVTYNFTWESTEAKWGTFAFFDINGRFVSRSNAIFSGSATTYSGTVTIPIDSYYYVVSWRTYGNCTASFSYNGSVYDMRNRIERGLIFEPLNGGFDYGRTDSALLVNEEVMPVGFRPVSDFIEVPYHRIAFSKNQNYSGVINVGLMQFDKDKNVLDGVGFLSIGENSLIDTLPQNVAYVRAVFDGAGNTNTASGTPTCEVIEQNVTIDTGLDGVLTPIIGGGGSYPIINTTQRTLWMPPDCVFFKNGFHVIASNSSTIDLTIATSSAKKVYYNYDTNEYEITSYNTYKNPKPRILICVLRLNNSGYPNSISINSPYYIDNKLYGLDISEIAYDSIAWAFNENVKGVNHRGYNTAPENTLPAYKLSKQVGFTYCETDVSMTSDRVPVLLHDDTINRTARNADGTEISSTINIGSITYEQALQYDFGIYKGAQYAGTKIPTFAQFIKLCKNLGLHPYIELKSGGGYTQAEVENLVDTVDLYGMQGKVTWISFSSSLLEYVKNYDAAARLGFIVGAATSANVTTANGLKTANNEVFLDVSSISSSIVGECASANIPVEIWTVNSASTIEGLDTYISGVTSDNLIASKVLYEANI